MPAEEGPGWRLELVGGGACGFRAMVAISERSDGSYCARVVGWLCLSQGQW